MAEQTTVRHVARAGIVASGQTPPPGVAAHWARRDTIRHRLAAVLAVPLLAVLLLLGDLVLQEIDEYGSASTVTRTITVGQHAQLLVDELQHERALTVGLLAGTPDARAELTAARAGADRERAALARLVDDGADRHATAQSALAQLDDLAAVRSQVDSGRVDRPAAVQYYTDRIAVLNRTDLGLDVPAPDPDPTLRRAVAAFQALSNAKEAVAAEAVVLLGTLAAGRFGREEYSQFVASRSARQAAFTEYSRFATPTQLVLLNTALKSQPAMDLNRFEQVALASADGRRIDVALAAWKSATGALLELLREVQVKVGKAIHDRAADIRAAAAWAMHGLAVLIILSVGGAIGLVIAASRAIARPLGALVAQAEQIATRRLPEAVELAQAGAAETGPPENMRLSARAGTEILAVAAAIDKMQHTAYVLATEQATLRRNTVDSLANLGRRTQNLLRKQLNFISQLERDEADPHALADLFELDHLATRLRRNAESLLVLVGEATPRRWSKPLPVADVIRAAIAEVEDYRRVALQRVDEAFLGGGYVTDVAHMLAELIENALAFSPPDADVEIHGRSLGRSYLIAIVDHGVGMEPSAMAAANARLRGVERFTVAPTRFLGHYVVGTLARELSIDVQIMQSPVTGVTARIVLPTSVLAFLGEIAAEPAEPAPVGAARIGAEPAVAARVGADQPTAAEPAGFGSAPRLAIARPEPSAAAAVPATGPAGRYPRSAPGVVDSAGVPERTPNGLLKRMPRARVAPRRVVAAGQPPVAPAVQVRPAEVRTMLTSLREGVQRGQVEVGGDASGSQDIGGDGNQQR